MKPLNFILTTLSLTLIGIGTLIFFGLNERYTVELNDQHRAAYEARMQMELGR